MKTDNFYDKIVKKAKEKGMSINHIEKETGLSTGSLCKWNAVSPTVRSLQKVAKCLDIPIEELLK